jgi:hypothetical protein
MNQPNRHARRRQRTVEGTRDPDVMYPGMLRRAARIERDLRAEGIPSLEIPGILGGAFMASLTNLSLAEREEVLVAHLHGANVMLQELLRAKQAPDGPMPDLGDIEP